MCIIAAFDECKQPAWDILGGIVDTDLHGLYSRKILTADSGFLFTLGILCNRCFRC